MIMSYVSIYHKIRFYQLPVNLAIPIIPLIDVRRFYVSYYLDIYSLTWAVFGVLLCPQLIKYSIQFVWSPTQATVLFLWKWNVVEKQLFFHVASPKMSIGLLEVFAICRSCDPVSAIPAERFRQSRRCFLSLKCTPSGLVSTGSNRTFTTCCCREVSIRLCNNQICHWEMQAARVWRGSKNVQHCYGTFSIRIIEVSTNGRSGNREMSQPWPCDVLFYSSGCTITWTVSRKLDNLWLRG